MGMVEGNQQQANAPFLINLYTFVLYVTQLIYVVRVLALNLIY